MLSRQAVASGVALFALGSCLAIASGDEIGDALRDAKSKRNTELSQAETAFLKAFDSAIVAAAKSQDADLVQALIDQKAAFQMSLARPEAKEVMAAFYAYTVTRKALDTELYKQYQHAANQYAENLLAAESKATSEDAKAFMAKEKLVFKSLGITAPRDVETRPGRTSADLVQTFVDAYDKEIYRAESQDTKARFQQVMKELPGKMDALLKSMTWNLHCPITEISEQRPGAYEIRFTVPDEWSASGRGWQIRSAVTMKLKKSEALAVEPGQILEISATPRFSSRRSASEGESTFMNRSYSSKKFAGEYSVHYVEFTKHKMEIRKAGKTD